MDTIDEDYKEKNNEENHTDNTADKSSKRIKDMLYTRWDKFCNLPEAKREAVMVVTQILLVLISIVSVWIVYWMTSKQNNLTEKSLDSTNRNYFIESRPYVFPGTPIAKLNDYGERLLILPIINYGHTPAYGVYYAMSYQKWSPFPNMKTAYFRDSTYDENVLPPNSTVTVHIPQHGIYWSSKDSCREFVVGKIWYSDGWNSKRHYTTFLYRMISRYDSSFEKYYETADTNEQIPTSK